jgi:type II secretory pathway component HofQ
MGWLQLSDDCGDECRNLSDAAFRTHIEGLLWAMRRENGGRFPKRELCRFAETSDPDKAVTELVSAGWWLDLIEDYRVVHDMQYQTEPKVLAKRRAATAERTRRWRRKAAGLPEDDA